MIDINDFKHKITTRNDRVARNKVYRHYCNNCGADRGYLQKSYDTPTCNKCSHLGIKLEEDTKIKMSKSATKRYNDPTWKPRVKIGYAGRRKRVYTRIVSDLQHKIRHNTRTLLRNKLDNHGVTKRSKTFDSLGYKPDDLIRHLESKFDNGMTWDNYGINGWEIDHIIPDSSFKYDSIEDEGFKKSWSLDNLQPMWASLNRSKGKKYQPNYGDIIDLVN